MKVKVVFENKKDKELVELVKFSTPFFVEYIDTTTRKGKKESFKIKNQYSAKLNPFVVILDDKDNFIRCFWSENGNAVQQFINYYL